MPHLYNRNAFAKGIAVPEPLLSTYCQLWCIEMLLLQFLNKNGTPQDGTHDIPLLLDALSKNAIVTPADAAKMSAFISSLQGAFSAVMCQGPKKTQIRGIRNFSYPDLRYVRHVQDFSSQSSTDADILALQNQVQYIYNELRVITKESV